MAQVNNWFINARRRMGSKTKSQTAESEEAEMRIVEPGSPPDFCDAGRGYWDDESGNGSNRRPPPSAGSS